MDADHVLEADANRLPTSQGILSLRDPPTGLREDTEQGPWVSKIPYPLFLISFD